MKWIEKIPDSSTVAYILEEVLRLYGQFQNLHQLHLGQKAAGQPDEKLQCFLYHQSDGHFFEVFDKGQEIRQQRHCRTVNGQGQCIYLIWCSVMIASRSAITSSMSGCTRRIRMVFLKKFKRVLTRYRNLQKLKIRHENAFMAACSRRWYRFAASTPVMQIAFSSPRLEMAGFVSLQVCSDINYQRGYVRLSNDYVIEVFQDSLSAAALNMRIFIFLYWIQWAATKLPHSANIFALFYTTLEVYT